MEDYLQYEFDTNPDDIVEVTLGQVTPAANVQLLDPINFQNYRTGQRFDYVGGYVTNKSPYRLRPPHPGHWHLVIDLGGRIGILRAEVSIQSVPKFQRLAS